MLRSVSSSIGVPLATVLSPSFGCLSSPSPQRAVLRLREWETPIDDHDGDPFHPRLPALLGDTASQRVIEVRYRAIEA